MMRSTINISILALLFVSCSVKKEASTPVVNLAEGKLIYENSCKACHGTAAEGNTVMKSPALAGLDGEYLLRQLQNFRNGARGNASADTLGSQMAIIAKTITDTLALRNVAAYIDSLPSARSIEKLSGDWKKGERTYQDLCGSCHGPAGNGNSKLNAPQLNNLASWYLKSQFEKFKTGLRGTDPKDKFGGQMTSITQVLKDKQEIIDVITYLRSEFTAAK